MKKHSITIAGHRTSITLEEAFWVELQRIAEKRQMRIHALVAHIDETRDLMHTNLSSALRLYVLDELKKQSTQS